MAVVEPPAEASNRTAVAEKNKPMRHTAPQPSDEHRLPPESGSVDQVQATLRRMPRNRTAHTPKRLPRLSDRQDSPWRGQVDHDITRPPGRAGDDREKVAPVYTKVTAGRNFSSTTVPRPSQ